jgi:DNA-binding transcriptional ArsR family regulator
MIDSVLQALIEPHRRQILQLLQNGELSSGEISARFEVTRPAISQHLKVLTDAGLVTLRKQGTKHFYRVRPEGLLELRQFLETFWDDSLQRLKQEAEAEERSVGKSGSKSK